MATDCPTRVKTGYGWPHDVSKKDLRIEYMRGSGNGGQKKQKTSSCVRITHIPTGIAVRCEESRQQKENLKIAFNRLALQLKPIMLEKVGAEIRKKRYSSGSDKVRNYNEPDQRVKDERVSNIQYSYNDVIEGDGLGEIIEDIIRTQSCNKSTTKI